AAALLLALLPGGEPERARGLELNLEAIGGRGRRRRRGGRLLCRQPGRGRGRRGGDTAGRLRLAVVPEMQAEVDDRDQDDDDDRAQREGQERGARGLTHVNVRALRRGGRLFVMETALARRN